jgi:hypothetical protein
MHVGLLQRSRLIPSGRRLAGLLVLWAFGLSTLDLPVHLVHHLGEVNPHCQLLGLSVSLNSSIPEAGWLPTADCTWDELVVPLLLPYVSLLWDCAQARPPPPSVQSR